MKVMDIRATDGPNYWSVRRHQLIVMLIDLEEMEEKPTNLIPGFYQRLKELIPSLYEHRCSESRPGGFFKRVEEGTWMGHVIEHIALEIQTLAGMATGFGRTRGVGVKGQYHVVFSYEDAEAGKYAAFAAVRIASALIDDLPYNINEDINAMAVIYAKNKLGPSTGAIVQEAVRKNIPFIRLTNESFFQLGYGSAQKRIEATIASTTGSIAVDVAGNKAATKQLLASHYIPVPEGSKISDEDSLKEVVNSLGYPLVIKPLDGNHGKGATTNITTMEEAVNAFRMAKKHSEEVICERFITGFDFRILVINYQFVAAALRTPAAVTGDGIHTISELVSIANKHPERGDGHENFLTKITIDEATINFLKRQGYSLDSVPAAGKDIWVKPTANLSTGGTATDVTDYVCQANRAIFERAARIVGLDICGIDVMAHTLSDPITETSGAILEINAAPGLRMHLQPTHGKPRNVAAPIVDMLFPNDANGRIPIVAITGTNGKTTTTRLMAHIGKQAGYRVGYTTTDGIYIQNEMVLKGDCTGPVSARVVLKDPCVDLAVLECARGGILRAGLGFDQCDIAIITNIGEDHLGLQGIDSIEKLTHVKKVVAESVRPGGCAVLNADDDNVYSMRGSLSCGIALFSIDPGNVRVRRHVESGGVAAVYENGYITILHGTSVNRIAPADRIPITFSGQATFNIANVLAASMAAYLQNIDLKNILIGLNTFVPCPETIPARMNIFDFDSFKVIVDYAHNTHGLRAVAGFLKSIPATTRVGIITGVGDRRDNDITSLGAESAKIFDEIIVRRDADLRGRAAEDIERLICQGIREVDPYKKIMLIPDELMAVDFIIKNAEKGTVAVVFVENIKAVINLLKQVQNMADNSKILQAREVA